MGRQKISLGRILGTPVGLDYSWFLVFILLTQTLAVGYYPTEFKNWPVVEYWLVGAVTAIMLFVSVLLHELGHSVIALRYKIPVRSITLFIFYGVWQMFGGNFINGLWIALIGQFLESSAIAAYGRLVDFVVNWAKNEFS